jgi:hypothetical protein
MIGLDRFGLDWVGLEYHFFLIKNLGYMYNETMDREKRFGILVRIIERVDSIQALQLKMAGADLVFDSLNLLKHRNPGADIKDLLLATANSYGLDTSLMETEFSKKEALVRKILNE